MFESVNPTVGRLMGLTSAEAAGKPAAQIFPADQAERMNANYRRCIEGGTILTYEELVGPSHNCRTFRTTLVPVRNSANVVHRIVGLAHDVTDERHAELALEESRRHQRAAEKAAQQALIDSEQRFRLAFDASPEALALMDAATNQVFEVNRGFERLFGLARAQVVGKSSLELGLWDSPLERERARVVVDQNGSLRDFPLDARTSSGSLVHCVVSVEPIEVSGQSAFLVVIRDVTKSVKAERMRVELEEQLRQAQKMDALGSFAGGIAHDFNNILAAIFVNAELIRMDLRDETAALEDVAELMKAAERAKDLVRRILTFSRKQSSSRACVSADVPVVEALRWLKATIPATITIESHLVSEPPMVLVDETQLQQVMMNLGSNAAYAMRNTNGRLTIRLEAVDIDERAAARHPDLQPRRYAKISVRDTGEGIAPLALNQIFEPFYTTKPRGEGTGLGLPVVHGIMREHEGAIIVESEPGKGTTFSLYLPEQTMPTHEGAPIASDLPIGHGESILLVDDEEALRRGVAALLRSLHYRVTVASTKNEALMAVERGATRFALVLTDLTLAGATGIELARQLQSLDASLPILVMSGFSGDYTPESLRSSGIVALIPKPLSALELATHVANHVRSST